MFQDSVLHTECPPASAVLHTLDSPKASQGRDEVQNAWLCAAELQTAPCSRLPSPTVLEAPALLTVGGARSLSVQVWPFVIEHDIFNELKQSENGI